MSGPRPEPHVNRTLREQDGRGGLACPECGQPIAIKLDDLLVRRAFPCRTPGCGVILRLDQRRSTAAIDNLRDLKGKLRDLGHQS